MHFSYEELGSNILSFTYHIQYLFIHIYAIAASSSSSLFFFLQFSKKVKTILSWEFMWEKVVAWIWPLDHSYQSLM